MKFKVTSNKTDKLKEAELEVEAIDETAAIAEFVKQNSIQPHSSSTHKFKAVPVEEDDRPKPEKKAVEEAEPQQVVERKTTKKSTKKGS